MDNFIKATSVEENYAVPRERPIGGLNPLLVNLNSIIHDFCGLSKHWCINFFISPGDPVSIIANTSENPMDDLISHGIYHKQGPPPRFVLSLRYFSAAAA